MVSSSPTNPLSVAASTSAHAHAHDAFASSHRYSRDQRPIYQLASLPVYERPNDHNAGSGQGAGQAAYQQTQPSRAGAGGLGGAGGRGVRLGAKPGLGLHKSAVEEAVEDLERTNPELYQSLQDMRRSLHGQSNRRYQQFESNGIFSHEENSVRATAALRVDLVRRASGLGAKSDFVDSSDKVRENVTIESRLEAIFAGKDVESALGDGGLRGAASTVGAEYKKLREDRRRKSTRVIKIQHDSFSKALSSALGRYRDMIQETLKDPHPGGARPSRRRTTAANAELEGEEIDLLEGVEEDDGHESMLNSAGDNLGRAEKVIRKLKAFNAILIANQAKKEEQKSKKLWRKAVEAHSDEAHDREAPDAMPEPETSDPSKEEGSSPVALASKGKKHTKSPKTDDKEDGPPAKGAFRDGRKTKGRKKIARRVQPVFVPSQEQMQAEERDRERRAREAEFLKTLTLDAIEPDATRTLADTIQLRFERIWTIMETPLLERIDMVLRYTSTSRGLQNLEPVLAQLEKCAGAMHTLKELKATSVEGKEEAEAEERASHTEKCKERLDFELDTLARDFGENLQLNDVYRLI